MCIRDRHNSVFQKDLIKCVLAMMREGIAYAYLLINVLRGNMTAADFVLYFTAITGFSNWLLNLLGQFDLLNQCNNAFSELREYFDYPDTFTREDGKTTAELQAAPATLELHHVSYRYIGAGKDTLNDFNLTLSPGEHLAVVGLNGAGKTTLVKLLCGLVDPTEGEVLYNGINVKDYNRVEYYRLFSAVFQESSLLPVPVAEVVAEAPSESLDIERVRWCLEQAGLWDAVKELPEAEWTPLGKSIRNDGVEFSGGQIQMCIRDR